MKLNLTSSNMQHVLLTQLTSTVKSKNSTHRQVFCLAMTHLSLSQIEDCTPCVQSEVQTDLTPLLSDS